MQYVVLMPEFHLTEVYIEADSKEEARERVLDGDGDYATSYYRHTVTTEHPLEVYDADSAEWDDVRNRELKEADAF